MGVVRFIGFIELLQAGILCYVFKFKDLFEKRIFTQNKNRHDESKRFNPN